MSIIFLNPLRSTVTIDGDLATGVDFTGIDPTIETVSWYDTQGWVNYNYDPNLLVRPAAVLINALVPYQTYIDEATDIIYAAANPVTYYFTQETTFEGDTYPVGASYDSTTVGWPAPPNTTLIVPPSAETGQTLQWNGSAWVVASFDITSSLPEAKSSLISTTTQYGASAVNTELGLYSNAQQIQAPNVLFLGAINYPGTTIGEYQTYVDGLVASSTATINAATSTAELYSFNPANVPFTPTAPALGVISTGYGGQPEGQLMMNPSYYVSFNSLSLTEADTEIYIPYSSTVIPYGSTPGGFASFDNVFDFGDYRMQIRVAATSEIIAAFDCPDAPSNEDVSF